MRDLCAALVVAATAVAGCRAERSEYFGRITPPDEDVLVFGNGAEPESIDPGLVYDSSGNEIVLNLFEGLAQYDPKTLKPIPGVAERWDISPDGKRYTFVLRENARWSDGRPVTAHDFVYAWIRVLTPETAAQNAAQLWGLRNGRAFNQGKIKDPAQVGVRALDDRTLEVELDDPMPYFLGLTCYAVLKPVRRDVVERWGDGWTRPEHIVSNGAFVLKSWTLAYQLVLEPNPHYWNRAQVRLDRAVAISTDDNHAYMRLYKAGELSFTGSNVQIPQEYVVHLKDNKDYTAAPYLSIYYFEFNTLEKPVNDPRVRRALNMAVDKRAITEYVTRAGQTPARHFVPHYLRDVTGYEPAEGDPYDPAAARQLLAEAGYPRGKGFPAIEVIYNTHDLHRQVAEAIQQMWKNELGIEVSLSNQEWKVFLDNRRRGFFQVARAGWVGDYLDPYTFLSLMLSDNEQNNTSWKDPEFDRLLRAAAASPDNAERNRLYHAAERRMLADMPVMPIYVYTRGYLTKPYVRGIWPNLQDEHPLQWVWIDRTGAATELPR